MADGTFDNLKITGNIDIDEKSEVRGKYMSIHYGNRGKIGEATNFNPDKDNNGLWIEGSHYDSESAGIFLNGNTMCLWSPGDNDLLRVYDEDGISKAQPKLVIGRGGNVGIGTPTPDQAKLVVKSPWADWIFLQQERTTEGGGGFHIHNPWKDTDSADRNSLVFAYRTSAGQDLWENALSFHGPTGNLHVNGDIISTGDVVLQNADCAEEFALNVLEEVEPGTVMVLDQDGALRPSNAAYDKKVAGVVSGAGKFKPAIVLDKKAGEGKRVPVALLGKVYCKVEASHSPIEIGDLLTTSPTSGYAMKASDPAKAFGAVLGKAMQPLKSGQGMIPILVALQ